MQVAFFGIRCDCRAAGADFMGRYTVVLLATYATVAVTVAAGAHHSIAAFDQAHPIELVGTVHEYRFTSPHTLIILEVLDRESHKVTWNLEGDSPNSLSWDGWSHNSLKPGDEVRLTIFPLRSGAPGGAWHPSGTKFKDGSPIVPRSGTSPLNSGFGARGSKQRP
jgi:Family of unknown function (DUF6152)